MYMVSGNIICRWYLGILYVDDILEYFMYMIFRNIICI